MDSGFGKKQFILLMIGSVFLFDILLGCPPELDCLFPFSYLYIHGQTVGFRWLGGVVKLTGYVLLLLTERKLVQEKDRTAVGRVILELLGLLYYGCYTAILLGVDVFHGPAGLMDIRNHLFGMAVLNPEYRIYETVFLVSTYLILLLRVILGLLLFFRVKRMFHASDEMPKILYAAFVAELVLQAAILFWDGLFGGSAGYIYCQRILAVLIQIFFCVSMLHGSKSLASKQS